MKVFSKRLVLVYTFIVSIPLAAMIITATEYLRIGQYQKIIETGENALEDNAKHIMDCIEVFYRIESTIVSNHGISDFFLFTERHDTITMVVQLRAISDELERLQVSLPLLYGIRIFVSDSTIPERWPIFFHQYRLNPPIFDTWQYSYRTDLMSTLEMGRNAATSYTIDLLFSKRYVGSMQVLMRMTDFFPFLYKKEEAVQHDFVYYKDAPVTDNEFGVTALPLFAEEPILAAADRKSFGSINIREGRKNHLFVWRSIPNSALLLIRDCSIESIQESLIIFRITISVGIIASIILLFFMFRFATQKMMGRLYVIINGMREVKQGNIDVGISVKGDDEISDMAHVFTDMTARIKKLIEEIKLEQQLVTETEIKAMQNQINAHFLYNVLETIKMQAELHDEDTIVHSITLLGKMLRYCLRLKQHRVSLREEMEYIRSYIALLNIRNDYSITLNEYISDRCMDYIIPKMLIQPLIENAFLYAIEPLGNNAAIDIRVYADDGDKILWIEVNDYGDGLNPDELEIVRINIDQERTEDIPGGIGLRNIQQRLTVFYGDAWRLHITSIPGKGTTIHIPIPMDAAACQLF